MKVVKQLPVEQFEATASQSTVTPPLLKAQVEAGYSQEEQEDWSDRLAVTRLQTLQDARRSMRVGMVQDKSYIFRVMRSPFKLRYWYWIFITSFFDKLTLQAILKSYIYIYIYHISYIIYIYISYELNKRQHTTYRHTKATNICRLTNIQNTYIQTNTSYNNT